MSIHRLSSILATTDLTPGSEPALATACTLGTAAGAGVHVFHCIRRPGPFGRWNADAEPKRLEEARRSLLAQMERPCGPSWSPASQAITFGRPVEAIAQRAREVEADLILLERAAVVASRAPTPWGPPMTGSYAPPRFRASWWTSPCPRPPTPCSLLRTSPRPLAGPGT
jgi:hypothetical protein